MSLKVHTYYSPDFVRKRLIKYAEKHDIESLTALKKNIFIFFIILFEIVFNFAPRIFNIGKNNFFIYAYICKILLFLNMVTLVIYSYRIFKARWIIYVNSLNISDQGSTVLHIFFDFMPSLGLLYEKIALSWPYRMLFKRNDIYEAELRAKYCEERRKSLLKAYFPSNHTQNSSDVGFHFNTSLGNRQMNDMNMGIKDDTNLINRNIYYNSSTGFSACSTPFKERTGPICINNVSPICPSFPEGNRQQIYTTADPIFGQHYQPSTPSPRLGDTYQFWSCWRLLNPFCYSQQPKISVKFMTIPQNQVWQKQGFDNRIVDEWIINLKKWIHTTIVIRVVKEITELNERFQEMGMYDIRIGDSSIQTLRMLCDQSGGNFSTLSILINFLDCSKDQGYVVNRLTELSQGLSLSKYVWNAGSTNSRHPWKEHLPNDAILLLHLFTTYVDSKHHTTPSHLQGVRSFSQQFIVETLDSREPSDFEDACVLYQSSVQPPIFKVIFDKMILDISEGRNNLFECLIMFLYKVYKNQGNFKWLNLGRSGMNINWIFNET